MGDAGRYFCRLYFLGRCDSKIVREAVERCLSKNGSIATKWREIMLGDWLNAPQGKRDTRLGGRDKDETRTSIDGSGKIATCWEVLLWVEVERAFWSQLKNPNFVR